ncbi:MAG: hypothetical protein AAFQ37_13090, partial [Bacteroidota bacterium]
EITSFPNAETVCGQDDGSIEVLINTSTSNNYEYVLNGSVQLTQDNGLFEGLSPEIYDVYVQLPGGTCQSNIIETEVLEGDPFDLIVVESAPQLCGENSGSLIVTNPAGDQYLYRRSINDIFSSENEFTGLPAGDYYVEAAYVVGLEERCNVNDIFTVPEGPSFSITPTPTDPTSCGGSDGRIEVSTNAPSNIDLRYRLVGVPGYRISGVFDSLPANTYTVEVSQFDGSCVSIETVTLTQPTSIDFSATPSPTIFCGQNSGTIVVDPIPGGPYEYNIDQGNFQTSRTFQNLLAGDYEIGVQLQGGGCFTTISVSVQDGPTQSMEVSISPPSVCGANDASIVVTNPPPGGNYRYRLDGTGAFGVSNTFNGLSAASYQVEVETPDAFCFTDTIVIIDDGPTLTITYNDTPTSVCGASDGTIEVTNPPPGGNYLYRLDQVGDFSASNIFSGLSAGPHTIEIQTSNGTCYTDASATITNGPKAPVSYQYVPPSYCGQYD